ncbi:MAG: c-type cytochrome domain-containing protein, partial [Chitinophagales bacterium]
MNKYLIAASLLLFIIQGCKKDKSSEVDVSNFPSEVGKILNTKCSISGCHNEKSKGAAGGLAMETWEQLFQGGTGGSVVIPYRPDQSWFMYYINTDTNRGVALTPTMPFNAPALTDAEYYT